MQMDLQARHRPQVRQLSWSFAACVYWECWLLSRLVLLAPPTNSLLHPWQSWPEGAVFAAAAVVQHLLLILLLLLPLPLLPLLLLVRWQRL